MGAAFDIISDGGEADLQTRLCEPSPAHASKAVASLPRSEDFFDAATNAVDRPVPSLKTRQRFRLVSTPHAGRSDAQTAALGLDGLAKNLSPIRAVGEYLAWLVRQGLRSGFAIIHVCGRNCDFLDQSRVGVGADMRLEAIDRRPAFVFDPARLVVAFARGGNDGGVDKRSCLNPDRLGLELGGDLVEQRLVQVLSDEGFPEPNEGGALRRGFIPQNPQ